MNLRRSLNRIGELFRIFEYEVGMYNKAGLFDINRLSEDVLIPLFRDVFDCPFLRNLNTETKNYPGLDLGDDHARVAFQITSDASLEKVKDALSKVIHHRLTERYDTVYVYVLTARQSKYTKKAVRAITKDHLEFDPDDHILDSRDLFGRIKNLEFDTIRRIEETLEVHFATPSKYFLRPAAPMKTEDLVLNLMPISFPDNLYVGTVSYVREEVIAWSRRGKFRLSPRSPERDVAWAALRQKNLQFSCDWIVRAGQVITFHKLDDERLALGAIVDPATVEPVPVRRYIRGEREGDKLDLDRLNNVKDLLRKTLQAQLFHRGIVWQHQEHVFIFVDPEDRDERKEVWSGGRADGRVVYHKVKHDDDPSRIWHHEHLAFQATFDLYEGQWHLSIMPTWFCSYDGYNKSRRHRNRVSYLKRNAFNNDVLTNLLFVTEILRKDETKALIGGDVGPRLRLGDLVRLEGAPAINDESWRQHDEKRKRKAIASKAKQDARAERSMRRRRGERPSQPQADLFHDHED